MMMSAREYAWTILQRVLLENGYANLLLRSMPKEYSRSDRNLITEIVYGTLRNKSMLEFQRKDLVKGRLRPRTAILLDMSVYQILYLSRIPAYAVIDEAVSLAQKKEKGFVNAVLRAIAKRGEVKPEQDGSLETLAIETSHPLFLLKLWTAHYGRETAEAIAKHNQQRPKMYGRLNTLKCRKEELDDPGITWLGETCFACDGVLSETEWFQEGKVLIQDRSSQMVVELLDAHAGMKVLDLCAAPGTKTQQIACMMENRGEITALDLYPERVGLIEQLMEKTGVSIVRCRAEDASVLSEDYAEESYDRILADVPCSGLGDLSHKPEIRFRVSPESIDELVALQKRILNRAAGLLKRGGILVYSTCTLNRKENEAQVLSFLKEHPDYALIREETVFPMAYDSDGFYMAALRKNSQD